MSLPILKKECFISDCSIPVSVIITELKTLYEGEDTETGKWKKTWKPAGDMYLCARHYNTGIKTWGDI